MAAGDEREAIAEVADRLCHEFGYTPDHGSAQDAPPSHLTSQMFRESLSEQDERLIATARQSLARIAAVLKPRMPAGVPEIAVPALLDGAELVMRSELATGNPLSAVMPSFVFLVALPLVDQDKALELSNRTASLLAEAIA